jgi:hypothetical protein
MVRGSLHLVSAVPHEHDRQTLFDRLGIGVSMTCAVHCVITAGVSLLPTMGISAATGAAMEWLELPLLVGALSVGLLALFPAYLREHKRIAPIGLFAAGMSLVIGGRFATETTLETALTVLGVGLIASAHAVNLRLHSQFHTELGTAH